MSSIEQNGLSGMSMPPGLSKTYSKTGFRGAKPSNQSSSTHGSILPRIGAKVNCGRVKPPFKAKQKSTKQQMKNVSKSGSKIGIKSANGKVNTRTVGCHINENVMNNIINVNNIDTDSCINNNMGNFSSDESVCDIGYHTPSTSVCSSHMMSVPVYNEKYETNSNHGYGYNNQQQRDDGFEEIDRNYANFGNNGNNYKRNYHRRNYHNNQPQFCYIRLLIGANRIGGLIGKRGTSVKEIREQCKLLCKSAKILINRQDRDEGGKNFDRICSIDAPIEVLTKALGMVIKKVNEECDNTRGNHNNNRRSDVCNIVILTGQNNISCVNEKKKYFKTQCKNVEIKIGKILSNSGEQPISITGSLSDVCYCAELIVRTMFSGTRKYEYTSSPYVPKNDEKYSNNNNKYYYSRRHYSAPIVYKSKDNNGKNKQVKKNNKINNNDTFHSTGNRNSKISNQGTKVTSSNNNNNNAGFGYMGYAQNVSYMGNPTQHSSFDNNFNQFSQQKQVECRQQMTYNNIYSNIQSLALQPMSLNPYLNQFQNCNNSNTILNVLQSINQNNNNNINNNDNSNNNLLLSFNNGSSSSSISNSANGLNAKPNLTFNDSFSNGSNKIPPNLTNALSISVNSINSNFIDTITPISTTSAAGFTNATGITNTPMSNQSLITPISSPTPYRLGLGNAFPAINFNVNHSQGTTKVNIPNKADIPIAMQSIKQLGLTIVKQTGENEITCTGNEQQMQEVYHLCSRFQKNSFQLQ